MRVRTFVDVLHNARSNGERGYVFLDRSLAEESWSFARMVREAERRAAFLHHRGVRSGDRIALVLESPRDFVLSFFGAVLAGAVPVPLYPQGSVGAHDIHELTTARILTASAAHFLLCSRSESAGVTRAVERLPQRPHLLLVEEIGDESQRWPGFDPGEPAPSDPCFLQFTSGSTTKPKGVIVTHESVVANATAMMVDALDVSGDADCGVSWLPLYHDMGLVGFVLAPMLVQTRVVFIPTTTFVRRPSVWMSTVSKYRGTITFAPNFAFALAARRGASETLDLSSLRVVGCGAEPIQARVLRDFVAAFRASGLAASALVPSYGLAEATLGVAFERAGLKTLTVERKPYETERRVVESQEADGSVIELVSCGRSPVHHEVAILDQAGNALGEGMVGEIALRGPSSCAGYVGDEEASASLFREGWMYTGDIGFLWREDLYVSGRSKDLIIVRGRNIDPQGLEWEAEQVDGVRQGRVAAFSVPSAETEAVVLVAEVISVQRLELASEIAERLRRAFGIVPAAVVLAKSGSLPKTSSGKVQRWKARERYLAGSFANPAETRGAHA